MVVVAKCKKCGQEFPSTLVNVSDEKMFKSHPTLSQVIIPKFALVADKLPTIVDLTTSGSYESLK
jgi:hypothetical protein